MDLRTKQDSEIDLENEFTTKPYCKYENVPRGDKHEPEHNLRGVGKWDRACLTKVVQNPSRGTTSALGRNRGNLFFENEWEWKC